MFWRAGLRKRLENNEETDHFAVLGALPQPRSPKQELFYRARSTLFLTPAEGFTDGGRCDPGVCGIHR